MPRITRKPYFIENKTGYVPTWEKFLPPPTPVLRRRPASSSSSFAPMTRAYKLSLVSVDDFTVTAERHRLDPFGFRPSLDGLEEYIERIASDYGRGRRAKFERGAGEEGVGGRWRMPLSCYQAFHAFLRSDPKNVVRGIPMSQLKVVTLGRAEADKSYPEPEALVERGVPPGLARALAPYQRGGVDFVLRRDGRALIADEMGLGKTIQGVAAMACWEKEWPLLVLCPSGARYHWEAEFLQWLGQNSRVNKAATDEKQVGSERLVGGLCGGNYVGSSSLATKKRALGEEPDGSDESKTKKGRKGEPSNLLHQHHIHVVSTSKDALFPHANVRVVICSYGLGTTLISSEKIKPGQFKCVIVDESHMLKNRSTKRTKTILPVLKSALRVVMLSGTPALAKPFELFPQLSVLGDKNGWWVDEDEFVQKYVKPTSGVATAGTKVNITGNNNLAELHALLTSTVMIRRLKADILKSLPQKIRMCARLTVKDDCIRRTMVECMQVLRQGGGILAKLSKAEEKIIDTVAVTPESNGGNEKTATRDEALAIIDAEVNARYQSGMRQIWAQVRAPAGAHSCESVQMKMHVQNLEKQLRIYTESYRSQRMRELQNGINKFDGMQIVGDTERQTPPSCLNQPDDETTRKSVLNKMFCLTGNAKVPLVVEMLKQWLADPTKGKLCVFAHHINVLDSIAQGAGLSNAVGSQKKFIRIDGFTNPRARQDQITAFQADPTIRIAVLGITAAGVAVTLTASSTVWFAELFWTPAIMIQAEDRCHRIGQQACVRCLYIIATGTLDELLWKLIEKKFRDLGEFVEGKEKHNIVVHQTCGDEILLPQKQMPSSEGGESKVRHGSYNKQNSPISHSLEDLADAGAIQHDIEELGKEEQEMLKNRDDDDEVDLVAENDMSTADGIKNSDEKEVSPTFLRDVLEENQRKGIAIFVFPLHMQLPQLRLYKMYFDGPTYGLSLFSFQGRVLVKGTHRAQFPSGQTTKPSVGDILVSVNRKPLSHSMQFSEILELLKYSIQNPITELIFAEDEELSLFFHGAHSSHLAASFKSQAVNISFSDERLTQAPATSSCVPFNASFRSHNFELHDAHVEKALASI